MIHYQTKRNRAVMFMRFRYFFLVLFVSLKALAVDDCERLWFKTTDSKPDSVENFLMAWNTKEKDCKGSPYFEYRKILLLYELKQFQEANRVLDLAKKKYDKQDSLIKFVSLKLERHSVIEGGDLSLVTVKKYLDLYLGLENTQVSKYSEYNAEVSGLYMLLHQDDNAIKYAKKSLDIGEWAAPLRILILIYDAKEDYVTARDYIDRLAKVDPVMLKNSKDILLTCARVYAGLGRMDLVNAVLQIAVQKSEKGKDDPEIQKTVAYIKNGIQTGKFRAAQ